MKDSITWPIRAMDASKLPVKLIAVFTLAQSNSSKQNCADHCWFLFTDVALVDFDYFDFAVFISFMLILPFL